MPVRPSISKLARRLWAGAALLHIAVAPAFAFDFGRSMDRGGEIGVYLRRVATHSGRHVISGDCMSACTLWLGHRGTCVTPDALLWFHAASDRAQGMRTENPWRTISVTGNLALLSMYPARVRAVVRPWLASPEFHTLTGAQLAALGVPLCRGAELAGDAGLEEARLARRRR